MLENKRLEWLVKTIDMVDERITRKLENDGPERGVQTDELQMSLEELRVVEEELLRQGEQLAKEHQHYEDLLNFTPYAYVETDPDGVIRETNPAAENLFQHRKQYLLGKPLVVFVAKAEHSVFRSRLNALRNGEGVEKTALSLTIQPQGGLPVAAKSNLAAMRDRRGHLTGIRWMFRDLFEASTA